MGRRGGGAGTSMATKDDYRFLNIADAFASINQKVCLIGVIVDHSLPKQSKGTDYCCAVRIVDASHPSHGLLVNFFAEFMDKLPKVESAGDVILLFHVVELFFDGYPGIDELTRKRNTFLGASSDGEAEDAPRNPPWMICCIKSYYLDKTNMWETRNYRIFETRLLC